MGAIVHCIKTNPISQGEHIYCHSRKDGQPGYAYLVINNSLTDAMEFDLPSPADAYVLSAETMRSGVMQLNGHDLLLGSNNALPELAPVKLQQGSMTLNPGCCAFVVL